MYFKGRLLSGFFCFKLMVYIFPFLETAVYIIQLHCPSLKVSCKKEFNNFSIKNSLGKSSEVFHPTERSVFS